MIAGPNGSGKTSLTAYLRSLPRLDFGFYVNADDLQAALIGEHKVRFSGFGIEVEEDDLRDFYDSHPLFPRCEGNDFSISRNVLTLKGTAPGMDYFAALMADYIRRQMLRQGVTFSFETVMSAPDKIELLKTAKESGYRIYLYFVTTADVSINIERVADRVKKSGHNVPLDKITSRYERSLNLLWPAIELADRTYIFDNSGEQPELVMEITPERKGIFTIGVLPYWVRKYVLSNF